MSFNYYLSTFYTFGKMRPLKNLLLLLLLFNASLASAQQTTVTTAFLEKWDNSKSYLLEMAEAMPDSLYDYQPTKRQMTFKEQLIHIKSNMDWLVGSYFSDVAYDRSKAAIPTTKTETIALLTASFDAVSEAIKNTPPERLQETVDFFAGPKSKLQILNLLQDHVSHHRGQLIVYLNLNEITPPKYVGW